MAKGTTFLSGFGDFSQKKQAGASPPAALPEPQVEKKNITRNTSPQIYNGTKNETDNNQGKFRSDIATKLIREHRYIFGRNNCGVTIVNEDVLNCSEREPYDTRLNLQLIITKKTAATSRNQ